MEIMENGETSRTGTALFMNGTKTLLTNGGACDIILAVTVKARW